MPHPPLSSSCQAWEDVGSQFHLGLELIFSPEATCLVGALGLPLLTCHGLILVPLGCRAPLCGSDLRSVLLASWELQVQLRYLPGLAAIPSLGWALGFTFTATMSGPCREGRWTGLLSPLLRDISCHPLSTHKGTDSHSGDTILLLKGAGLEPGHPSQAE